MDIYSYFYESNIEFVKFTFSYPDFLVISKVSIFVYYEAYSGVFK